MAATKKLAKFTITEAGEGFNLHIEDEAGHVLELLATRDQLDVIPSVPMIVRQIPPGSLSLRA